MLNIRYDTKEFTLRFIFLELTMLVKRNRAGLSRTRMIRTSTAKMPKAM